MSTGRRPILTLRQRQVVRAVAEGYTNDEIAAQLNLGTATIHRHLKNLRFILGARNRAHAASLALVYGILRFDGKEFYVNGLERPVR